MATRYNSGDPFGIPGGYDGAQVPSDGFKVPSCGILDVDRSLFDVMDKEIRFVVSNGEGKEVAKVPVIFASGEKAFMLKKGKAIRDANSTLILPLITIRRTSIEQSMEDMAARGINQNVGELIIKRRLSPKDRAYQNLINKLGIKNQSNVADDSPSLDTDRNIEANAADADIHDGALLASKYGNNFWELIKIPMQQFFVANYEVTFWAQYTTHMNQLLQRLMGSYLSPGAKTLRLETPKGYWFVATIQDDPYTSEDNADDMSSEERLLKYKFNVRVPAYMVAAENPGEPSQIRSVVSAPLLTFGTGTDEDYLRVANQSDVDQTESDDPSKEFSLFGEIQPRDRQVSNPLFAKARLSVNPFTGRETYVVHAGPSFEMVPQTVQSTTATPAITWISDRVIDTRGSGRAIEVHGMNFLPGATVIIDGVSATNVNYIDDTLLTCTPAPHAPGVYELIVRNPSGRMSYALGNNQVEYWSPDLLPLTGFWRDFSGMPWNGTASAGVSAANAFSTILTAPSVGTQNQRGILVGATGAGARIRTAAATSTFLSGPAWTIHMVYRPTPTAVYGGVYIGDSDGWLNFISQNSTSTEANYWDNVLVAKTLLCSNSSWNAWTVLQAVYDGSIFKMRINGGPWSHTAAGALFDLTSTFSIGFLLGYEGMIAEIFTSKAVISDALLEKSRLYARNTYDISV